MLVPSIDWEIGKKKKVTTDLPFHYDFEIKGPYKDKHPDSRFVSDNDSVRKPPVIDLRYTTLQDIVSTYAIDKLSNLSVYPVSEFLKYLSKLRQIRNDDRLTDKRVLYGWVQKYWPLIDSLDLSSLKRNLSNLSYRISHTNTISEMSQMVVQSDLYSVVELPQLIIYTRETNSPTLLNLQKIFADVI